MGSLRVVRQFFVRFRMCLWVWCVGLWRRIGVEEAASNHKLQHFQADPDNSSLPTPLLEAPCEAIRGSEISVPCFEGSF